MIYFIIEIIGSIAFAVSGAMLAIGANMDLLGVIVLGEMTAFGGGCLRDVLMGKFPATVFQKPRMAFYAFISIIVVFFVLYYMKKTREFVSEFVMGRCMNIMDGLGLGAFTVIGINAAIGQGYTDNSLFVLVLGVLTGVGGGIIRDILAGKTPAVFRKHIYACASIAGALVYFYGLGPMGDFAAPVAIGVVLVIRILAYEYCWDLPKLSPMEKEDGAN